MSQVNLDFGQKPFLESIGFLSLGDAQGPSARIASGGKLSFLPHIPLGQLLYLSALGRELMACQLFIFSLKTHAAV